MTADMMDMLAKEMAGIGMMDMDTAMMQECMEACMACEQACTMCADSMSGEGMAKCMSMCMTMADMCNTMMRMMMRPTGMDMPAMMAMMNACMMMGTACADECMMHAEMSPSCAMCAQVCMNMVAACEKMMSSMKTMAM